MIALAAGTHQLMQGLLFEHPLFQEFPAAASALSRAASGGLIAAIWQGVLLAAVAALALRLLPRTPAAVRFAVWFAIFALVAALPFLSFAPNPAAAVSPGAAHSPLLTLDPRWTLAIAAVWIVASLVRAVTLAAAALRVRALWKRATPIETEIAIAGTRHAQVCVSSDVDRPTVIGFLAPKILIPGWLLEKLTAAELEQVVLHEAGHLGRADDWMNLLQKIALVLFPLNPALAWVERRLCFERELACDERVLQALAGKAGAATQYASCLATLAEYRLQHRDSVRRGLVRNLTLALGALGTSARESELGRRVRRILRPSAKMRPLHARLVMGGAMLGLLVAATGLERCPQLVAFGKSGAAVGVTAEQTAIAEHGTAIAEHGTAIEEQGIVARRTGFPSAALHNVSLHVDASRTQAWKTVGDAAPLLATTSARGEGKQTSEGTQSNLPQIAQNETAQNSVPQLAHIETSSANPETAAVHATPVRTAVPAIARPAARAMETAFHPATAGTPSGEPDGDLIVTRWVVTTWQASDGARLIETSAQTTTRISRPTTESDSSARHASSEPQQFSQQQPSPYAAVPVPGGWLVFQL